MKYGSIFSDDFDRGALGGNYAITGAGTFTVTSNALVVGNGNSDLLRYAKYTAYYTCLEKWTMTASYTLGTLGALSTGVGFGVQSTGNFNFTALLLTLTGAFQGKIRLYSNNGSILATSNDALTVNTGDTITMVLKRNRNYFSATYTNANTGQSVSQEYTYAFTYPASSIFTPAVANFTIYSCGGTHTVNEWYVESTETKKAKYCFVGDSITAGYFAGDLSSRYSTMFDKKAVVLTGPGNFISSCQLYTNEIIALKPDTVILCAGTNDVISAVALATSQTNYTNLVNTLEAAGIRVIKCLIPPNNTASVVPLNNWISSTYGADCPDFYTPLKDGGTGLNATYDPGDGLHPNGLAQPVMASVIL